MEGRYHQLSSQSAVVDALIRSRVSNPHEAKQLEDRLRARISVLESDNNALQARFQDAQGQEQLIPEQKEILETLKVIFLIFFARSVEFFWFIFC